MKVIKCPRCGGSGLLPDQKSLGAEFRKLRKGLNVSLRTAAKMIACSPAFLSELENGHRNWSNLWKLRYIDAMAQANKNKK